MDKPPLPGMRIFSSTVTGAFYTSGISNETGLNREYFVDIYQEYSAGKLSSRIELKKELT
ncbi:hypothetical protein P9847_16990 [Paenibacillus chibensis]|uniref:Uncharacterized protein n=1 Tax=Paenibacillus chibensis TaxID=59846 RepID=A0ABU6PY42_9BACL|nr:hypothetical protein [Paenibacillus chibensis]